MADENKCDTCAHDPAACGMDPKGKTLGCGKYADSGVKPTNPKDAIGIRKVPMSCFSSQCAALIAHSMVAEDLVELAARGRASVSKLSGRAIALMTEFWEGIGDQDSIPKVTRAMANVLVMRHLQLEDRLDDDRSCTGGIRVHELNKAAGEVLDKFAENSNGEPPKPPFTEVEDGKPSLQLFVDLDQAPWHVLPWRCVLEGALGMMEGAAKYRRHNYRVAGVRASVYYDACFRHLTDFMCGQNIDPQSGLSHLTKFQSSMSVLVDSMVMGNWIDDRPPRVNRPAADNVQEQNCHGQVKAMHDWALRHWKGELLPGDTTCPSWIRGIGKEASNGTCTTCGRNTKSSEYRHGLMCVGPLCLYCSKLNGCAKSSFSDSVLCCSEATPAGDDD